jgi:hypothetical protein
MPEVPSLLSNFSDCLWISFIKRSLYVFNVEALFVVPHISQLSKGEPSGHCNGKGSQVVKKVSPQEY